MGNTYCSMTFTSTAGTYKSYYFHKGLRKSDLNLLFIFYHIFDICI
mgnify:FL=1